LTEYRATITAHEPLSQFGHSRTSTTPGRLPLEQLEWLLRAAPGLPAAGDIWFSGTSPYKKAATGGL